MIWDWTKTGFSIACRLISRSTGNTWRRTRVFALNMVGKNPYKEGSFASLRWKVRRGEPLSEDEEQHRQSWEAAAQRLSTTLQFPPHVAYGMAYLSFALSLLDDLPKRLRDDLDRSSISQGREKIQELLPLASYKREKTSIKLAYIALIISVLATLISVATLAFAVWASYCATTSPTA